MNLNHLVIHTGSLNSLGGFSGDRSPIVQFPSVVGKLKCNVQKSGPGLKDGFVGREAEEKKGILKLKSPLKDGIILDWDDIEKIWSQMFEDLQVESNDRNLLITESPLNTDKNREKMAEIMFETFGVPGLYIGNQCVLSLYSLGKVTGLVLDSGDSTTHAIPIVNGTPIKYASRHLQIGGKSLTKNLRKMLLAKNEANLDMELFKDMKEKLCYVAIDYEKELKLNSGHNFEQSYKLPDGETVKMKIGNESFKCPEAFFKPNMGGFESKGIHEIVQEAVVKTKLESNEKKDLYRNIVLTGGSTKFPGLHKRLNKELRKMNPLTEINILQNKEKINSVWVGGSVIASHQQFSDLWITKNEYFQSGNEIVHRKSL